MLRLTGILHPYWGKYLVLGSPGEDGFSRLLARDPVITRPLYLLERLILWDKFLHEDRKIYGELTSLEIEETFREAFRQPMPRGLVVKSARFRDVQYSDIMRREIVAEVPQGGASEVVRFLEDLQALADKDVEDDYYIAKSSGAPGKAKLNPKAVLEPGEPIEFRMGVPGVANSTLVHISADRRFITVRWSISD